MTEVRNYWLHTMLRIVNPVLNHLADRNLNSVMPVGEQRDDCVKFTHLEALGRSLSGLSPWLEQTGLTGDEEKLRQRYAELAREAIDAGTDPDSPDYMNFSMGSQPIVDAAFLAHAIVRAPKQLLSKLDSRVKGNLVRALQQTRSRKPNFSNWLLFGAMIETALYVMGEEWDRMRVDYALRQHGQWYVGDGVYGDGPEFHFDYYNSFVIQPMLIDIVATVGKQDPEWSEFENSILERAQRYASILERMISPEGAFPPIGRSLAYRFGAFQHLSQLALQHKLPLDVKPSQLRSALTAVIRRMMDMPGIFDDGGWLTIGFAGYQPEIGEHYISTGSLYLCSTVFLPLGLTPEDPFWSEPDLPWTSLKAWGGQPFPIDGALRIPNIRLCGYHH